MSRSHLLNVLRAHAGPTTLSHRLDQLCTTPSGPIGQGFRNVLASRLASRTARKASTSFWSHSYGPSANVQTLNVPYGPPSPAGTVPIVGSSSAGQHSTRPGMDDGDVTARKMERKQRYLDGLMDKAGELSLRCSIIDAEGKWTAEEGRYKKTELCKDYDLDPRDLRKLDSLSPNLVPIILTRKTCILISILHIRALIKPDRVIVFDMAGSVESEVQKRFKWHLERNIKAGLAVAEDSSYGEPLSEEEIGLTYEHRALESILVATANALEEEMRFTRQLVQQLLSDLEENIDRENLKRLLHYSRRMVGFQSRARYVKQAFDELLDSDEDLSAMYLSARAAGRPRALHDHEQLEILLESFVKQVEEIVSEIDTTVANINSTQEIAELMLDTGRNALLALDIKVSIATFGVGCGALVAGFFGMNLATQVEAHPYAFYWAAGGATCLAILVTGWGMRILRRVRRVALSGTRPRSLANVMHAKMRDPRLAATSHAVPAEEAPMASRIRPTRPSPPAFLRLFRRESKSPPLPAHSWAMRARVSTTAEEPVWINHAADRARARDAYRAEQMEQREAEIERKKAHKEMWRHGKSDEEEWKEACHWRKGKMRLG